MHWTAIQQAKEKGCSFYNLGGINHNNKRSSWAGITHFKDGFGGQVKEYIGTLELPLNQAWFKAYKLINLFRK